MVKHYHYKLCKVYLIYGHYLSFTIVAQGMICTVYNCIFT